MLGVGVSKKFMSDFRLDLSKNQLGVTLVEVLLAVALVLIVVVSLSQLGITALRTADAGRSRATAVGLTREAIEAARSLRDQDSDAFFALRSGYYSYGGSFIFVRPAAPNPPYSDYQVPSFANYRRVVQFTPSPDKMEVNVTTYWQEYGSYPRVSSSTTLTKWR